ncbi:hypothetical protein MUK72_01605 [Halococcus dombrowskii]|nr:hypothetical protein [Halococcus dombrowskii]UOO95419.1 hypothetical protein MUK72_01605 [Halococcus dombrowskii]
MTATDATTDRADPDVGDVLYETDSHERYAVVVATDSAGVTLCRNDSEQFIPHTMFAPWNDASITVEPATAGSRRTDPSAHRTRPRHELAAGPAGTTRFQQS